MATFAIGDIQGCFQTLTGLLKRIRIDPKVDRLWVVGDLVNRGPHSLEVLRWASSLGERLTAVLGNHDLHLLALAAGIREPKARDTLNQILEAPDREDLLGWLASRPLLHCEGPLVLVHAGLLPAWSPSQARRLAGEVESKLRGEQRTRALKSMFEARAPLSWDDKLSGPARLRVITNALTRMRTCTPEGRMCLDYKGPPNAAPAGCTPWFDVPGRSSRSATIVCGHWADLGLRVEEGLYALDTGCVWGGSLTAIRLEDGEIFQEQLSDADAR
jgi:bis(5'-nucleosyl)-tetraphosphatase (symmetrical)